MEYEDYPFNDNKNITLDPKARPFFFPIDSDAYSFESMKFCCQHYCKVLKDVFTDGGEERMEVKEMAQNQVNQTFTVDKLPPFTNFTFYVRSYNIYAASDNSQEVICQTGESGK